MEIETERNDSVPSGENVATMPPPARAHIFQKKCLAPYTMLCTSVVVSVLSSLVFVGFLAYFLYQYRADFFPQIPVRANDTVAQVVPDNAYVREPIVAVVEEAKKAVVSVVVTKDVPVLERYYERIDPFEEWGPFGGITIPRIRERGTQEREVGGGTGFFVSDDGMLVTNKHVVADDDARYSIVTNDGDSYDAEVLVRDSQMDIAILHVKDIPDDAYAHLIFGNASEVRPGQTVIAIGNALTEFRNSVSVGVVSGVSRSIVAGDMWGGASEFIEGVIQTDAAINPGNSGGPLLDLQGRVIGVNVAVVGGAENIGFALPANVVERTVTSVQEFGEIRHPYFGVRYITLNNAIAKNNDLPVAYGAWVRGGIHGPAVLADSPAMRARILENDIIISFDGVSLENGDITLATLVRQKSVGDTVPVVYLRNGERRTITVTLENTPSDE